MAMSSIVGKKIKNLIISGATYYPKEDGNTG